MLKGGDNVFNAKCRPNEIGQCWCLADLLDFQLETTGTSKRPSMDTRQTHVAWLQQHVTWVLLIIAHWTLTGQYNQGCYSLSVCQLSDGYVRGLYFFGGGRGE